MTIGGLTSPLSALMSASISSTIRCDAIVAAKHVSLSDSTLVGILPSNTFLLISFLLHLGCRLPEISQVCPMDSSARPTQKPHQCPIWLHQLDVQSMNAFIHDWDSHPTQQARVD